MEKSEIIKKLKKGGIGVLPTDTIYGVLGSALKKATVERIYRVKGRNETKPFIILISSLTDLKNFGVNLSIKEKKYLKKVWPGPVSVILPCTSTQMQKKLKYLHRGTNSFAFRMPKDAFLTEILKKTGPLVAPSANPEGFPPAETITDAEKYFSKKIDFYFGEKKKLGKASTLVSIVNGTVAVLRQGAKKVPKSL